jgi:nucleotide-binding universal stress UspA family protein
VFKNILVPTDGSDLAAKAVEQAVLFAKEIGAKITAVTITEPFQAISVKPSQLEYTPLEYKKHAEIQALRRVLEPPATWCDARQWRPDPISVGGEPQAALQQATGMADTGVPGVVSWNAKIRAVRPDQHSCGASLVS